MSNNKITIKDVAAAANVHSSTVSRVLNPDTRSMVSESVARRVAKIADELGYARSALASSLRTGRSYTIGVIIPDLSNPVFPPVVRGIERALSAAGYIALLADSDNNPQSERAIYDSLRSRSIDGLILATAHTEDPIVTASIDAQLPLVLVNRTVASHAVTEVINNDSLGIELAVSHLIGLGHRRIAFLGGPQNTSTGLSRYAAFERIGGEDRFAFAAELCVSCEAFTEIAGAKGMQSILQHRGEFTAVVAANDLLAIGCYDALASAGLNCPNDVSVTGFNDMPFVDRLSPPLTSVHIQHDELGVRAATMLLEEIRGVHVKPRTVSLDPELVIRGSTAPPKS